MNHKRKYISYAAKKIAMKYKHRQYLARNRAYVTRAKMRPCTDCGVQYNPWMMQFDHRDPRQKSFELSALKKSYSLRKLLNEIHKCDVVCANCHADRTYRDGRWRTGREIEQPIQTDTAQGELFGYAA